MKRREFLRYLALGLAGGWALSRPNIKLRPGAATLGGPEMRLAFLADAHLKDADQGRPEALALARAVAELRALKPGPDLVLFAGDLARHGHPGALALGKEILAGLPGPLLMLMGEGDGLPDGATPWRRLFGEPRFSRVLRKTGNSNQQTTLQIVGLHTAWCPGPGGPFFRVGGARPPAAGPAACQDGPRSAPHPPLPRPPGPHLSALATVDRGLPRGGSPAGRLPPGPLPPWPYP